MSERGAAAAPGPLFKTAIVIWSEYPGDQVELEQLAREATSGGAYCSRNRSEAVQAPQRDPDWDGGGVLRRGAE